MTKNNYKSELKYLEHLDINQERKVEFIESLYRLSHINFNEFIKK